ncbi:hypothetical protein ACIRRH_33610 [Kitasatospora sp. NPDC101235]|uniref:hypothetical protein n=1 Tax=Kitasatospora sp. NPDC101235 TaxID=3364101 RepID=UPI003826E988
MSATRRSDVATFGWNHDWGEFVIAPQQLDTDVREILGEAGFVNRAEPLGAWHMSPMIMMFEQADAAALAVRQLAEAGVQVRNWHAPQQRSPDVVRHYDWLTSEGPFHNAGAVAREARTEAVRRLGRAQSPDSRVITERIASGELLVEARRTFDDTEFMIASERGRPNHYLELLHRLPESAMYITGDVPEEFAGHTRRAFRQMLLRDTRPPTAVRASAAAASRRFAPGRRPTPGAAAPPSAAASRRR